MPSATAVNKLPSHTHTLKVCSNNLTITILASKRKRRYRASTGTFLNSEITRAPIELRGLLTRPQMRAIGQR